MMVSCRMRSYNGGIIIILVNVDVNFRICSFLVVSVAGTGWNGVRLELVDQFKKTHFCGDY